MIYLRDYQRRRDEILLGCLYPLADPYVIFIPAVNKSDHHRGVEHGRQLLAESGLDQVTIRLRPEIPRTLENTARQGPGPLDHRGGENAAHELSLGDTLRNSPTGESPVYLRIDIQTRLLHNLRLPPTAATYFPLSQVLDRA